MEAEEVVPWVVVPIDFENTSERRRSQPTLLPEFV